MYTRNKIGPSTYTLDYRHIDGFLFLFASIYIDDLPPARQVTLKPIEGFASDTLAF